MVCPMHGFTRCMVSPVLDLQHGASGPVLVTDGHRVQLSCKFISRCPHHLSRCKNKQRKSQRPSIAAPRHSGAAAALRRQLNIVQLTPTITSPPARSTADCTMTAPGTTKSRFLSSFEQLIAQPDRHHLRCRGRCQTVDHRRSSHICRCPVLVDLS